MLPVAASTSTVRSCRVIRADRFPGAVSTMPTAQRLPRLRPLESVSPGMRTSRMPSASGAADRSHRRRVPSAPAVTTIPAGSNFTSQVRPMCPTSCRSCTPVVASKTRTTPSRQPVAIVLPAGEKSQPCTHEGCRGSVSMSRPVARSQTRGSRSVPADRSFVPSRDRATWPTVPSCPGNIRTSPLATSSTATMPPQAMAILSSSRNWSDSMSLSAASEPAAVASANGSNSRGFAAASIGIRQSLWWPPPQASRLPLGEKAAANSGSAPFPAACSAPW